MEQESSVKKRKRTGSYCRNKGNNYERKIINELI